MKNIVYFCALALATFGIYMFWFYEDTSVLLKYETKFDPSAHDTMLSKFVLDTAVHLSHRRGRCPLPPQEEVDI